VPPCGVQKARAERGTAWQHVPGACDRTNRTCIVTAPIWLRLGEGRGVAVEPVEQERPRERKRAEVRDDLEGTPVRQEPQVSPGIETLREEAAQARDQPLPPGAILDVPQQTVRRAYGRRGRGGRALRRSGGRGPPPGA
jgi:hypothetical protein